MVKFFLSHFFDPSTPNNSVRACFIFLIRSFFTWLNYRNYGLVSRKSWPQNVGLDYVYYRLKCSVNWENKKNNLKEEVLAGFLQILNFSTLINLIIIDRKDVTINQ